jgi:hypothetical protein
MVYTKSYNHLMLKRNLIVAILFLLVLTGGCVEMKKPNDTWESSGPIKIRLQRKYHRGNDYYFFDVSPSGTGRWNRIISAWRDASGSMPIENIHILDAQVAYLFLVDQVAITKDGGKNWTVFNASTHFACGWDGCANIRDLNLYGTGVGRLIGQRRVGTNWVEYQLATNDFGVTWMPA